MNSSDNNLTPTEVRHPTVDGSTGHRRRQDFEEAGSFPQVNRNDCVNGVRLRSADQTVWNPRLQESDQSDEGIDSGAAKGKRTKIKKSDSGTSVNSTNENDVKITQIGDSIYRNKSLLDNDSSDDDDHCDNDGSENDVTKSKRSMIASVFRKAPSVHRSKRNTSASKETRSLTSASILSTHESLSHKILRHSNTWDDFVRNGARFKTLVEDAMSDVKSSLSLGRDDDKSTRANAKKRLREPNEQHPDEANTSRKRTMRTEIYESGKRAREKTAEALNLQRLLKDAVDQSMVLKAANQSLRKENASSHLRLEKTVEHLRIAGSNASKARNDAEATEATAASLAQSLQAVQSVVTETKRISQELHKGKQNVQSTVSSVESKLLRMEADLAKSQEELYDLRLTKQELEKAREQWKEERISFEQTIKLQNVQLAESTRTQLEHEASQNARRERADKKEREYLHTQSLLVEATAGQEKAEKALQSLQETIVSLQKSNEEVHAQLSHYQAISELDIKRLSDALCKTEKEAQQLRIQAEDQGEEAKRMRLDKSAADKYITELKGRVSNLEKTLSEATTESGASLSNSIGDVVVSPDGTAILKSSQMVFGVLPPLSAKKQVSSGLLDSNTTEKENNSATMRNVNVGNLCAICFKASVGIMKTCQCGRSSCNIRAHVSCANRINPGPSVSHPGTPAPRLPIILCGHESSTPSQSRTPLGPCLTSTAKKFRSDHKRDSQVNL